jgi:hypothetical protein
MKLYASTAFLAALIALAPAASKAQAPGVAAAKPIRLAQAAPPPLPQPPAVQYYYNEGGKPVGPVTLAEIQAKIAAGAITPDTLIWKTGAPAWAAAKTFAEVAALFAGGGATPAPTPSPTPAPAPVAASGCTGKVLLTDDFRQVDSSWGTDSNGDSVTVEDGKVKIKADVNSGYTVLYGGLTFDDAEICVTAQVPKRLTDIGQLAAGPVFWAEDYSNFYTFNVAPDGTAAILRKVKGKYIPVIAYRKTDGIKTQPGDKNQLRLVTSGVNITAYINGVKFASARGQPPAGGGQVGLRAESEKAQRDTWKFQDFKVTQLAAQ